MLLENMCLYIVWRETERFRKLILGSLKQNVTAGLQNVRETKQDRQCARNVTIRSVRATVVAGEKQ
jgi:hypothetical protein